MAKLGGALPSYFCTTTTATTTMSSFFPSYNVAQMDFADDDLVGLVSSERSTTQHKAASATTPNPHNIFDISAPPYTAPPYHFSPHFNSTIPPLASYDSHHPDNGMSRSRSRSRPPSIGPGPTRSSHGRNRRTNSISSTSPPPGGRPNPAHIMIPTRPQAASPPPNSALSTGWYIPPTPDSLGNPHSLPYNHYGQDDGVSNMVSASFPNFSSTVGPGAAQNAQDKQSLLANEKRRRRRESHNAVERRRRDNINEKITELATLIPECLLEGATPNGSSSANAASPPAPDELWGGLLKDESPPPGGVADVVPGSNNNAAGVIKANKGMILTKSVEYIRFLQQLVTAQGARNRELENELRGIRGEPVPPSYSSSNGFDTSFTSSHGHGSGESAFSGSPLGDVQEEEEPVKREDDDDQGRRGRRRVRGAEMDVDGE